MYHLQVEFLAGVVRALVPPQPVARGGGTGKPAHMQPVTPSEAAAQVLLQLIEQAEQLRGEADGRGESHTPP